MITIRLLAFHPIVDRLDSLSTIGLDPTDLRSGQIWTQGPGRNRPLSVSDVTFSNICVFHLTLLFGLSWLQRFINLPAYMQAVPVFLKGSFLERVKEAIHCGTNQLASIHVKNANGHVAMLWCWLLCVALLTGLGSGAVHHNLSDDLLPRNTSSRLSVRDALAALLYACLSALQYNELFVIVNW